MFAIRKWLADRVSGFDRFHFVIGINGVRFRCDFFLSIHLGCSQSFGCSFEIEWAISYLMFCYFQVWLLFKETVFPVFEHCIAVSLQKSGHCPNNRDPIDIDHNIQKIHAMQFLSATINRPIPIELRNWTVISEFNFWWKGTWKSFFGLEKKGTKKKIDKRKWSQECSIYYTHPFE